MSSSSCTQLTEEQKQLLKSLEEEFKDRYTENDEEFKAALEQELPPPPIMADWVNFHQRDNSSGYRQFYSDNRFGRYDNRYYNERSYSSRRHYYNKDSPYHASYRHHFD